MNERVANESLEQARIALVIEDDADIRELIITVFKQAGFKVFSSENGLDGVDAARRLTPDIVTVDLGLPDIDGLEVTRRIRLESDCYIIMITARTDEAETLMGLNEGADDYITKPFRPRELRARVGAMLRRPRVASQAVSVAGSVPEAPASRPPEAAIPAASPSSVPTPVVEHSGLTLDADVRSVKLGEEPIELTRTEFDLLHTLMSSGRRVRTKADLVRHLRADLAGTETYVSEADERAVEVHIGNLRRKLSQNKQSVNWIDTVRGVGYRMAAAPGIRP